ncbi:MAG: CocE/NonD family hydrolase [Ferruginibacter sp.]|nr:CocE/NonD family hydrolase [Cytophagales bacterium]
MPPLFSHFCPLLTLGVCLSVFSVRAQSTSDSRGPFEKTEKMIPMRDGVKLHTAIYAPKSPRERLPILFVRTPYGVDGADRRFDGPLKELADEGYVFVFQDIRGRYRSEGQFVMQRSVRDPKDQRAIDESTDAYDTVDWLVKNVPNNNGRVGMLGVSYDGWTTVMAMLDPHPALKAVSPQASPADMFLGDDFHHNGAFRLSYGFEYATMMETSKENEQFTFDAYDTYEWYLRLGSLANVNEKYLHHKIPTWNDYVAHPNYDAFWQRQAAAPSLTRVTMPTLNVAGWWDQEDFYGPMKIYEELEKHDTKRQNYLVVGPWNHGGWAGEGNKLGNIDFGSSTGKYFREKIQAPWFAYFLKDKGKLALPEALTFRSGTNRWESHEAWPPRRNVTNRNLYFHANGRLSFEPPASDEAAFDGYVSDPAHPVPYRPRPIEPTYFPNGSGWYTWLVGDQRFAHQRPDVLSWETEPLAEDLTVSGNILTHLFAATSGTDSDWIVKLIDVYPETYSEAPKMGGYQLMVSNEVLRGRFRNSFSTPEPIPANQVQAYTLDIHGQDHTFLKGHKVMVQVQSTWFPVIDRNPQRYVDNIFAARETDFQPATQRVFRSRTHASHVTLPVVSK